MALSPVSPKSIPNFAQSEALRWYVSFRSCRGLLRVTPQSSAIWFEFRSQVKRGSTGGIQPGADQVRGRVVANCLRPGRHRVRVVDPKLSTLRPPHWSPALIRRWGRQRLVELLSRSSVPRTRRAGRSACRAWRRRFLFGRLGAEGVVEERVRVQARCCEQEGRAAAVGSGLRDDVCGAAGHARSASKLLDDVDRVDRLPMRPRRRQPDVDRHRAVDVVLLFRLDASPRSRRAARRVSIFGVWNWRRRAVRSISFW
jgi:hypothetical protein